MQFFHMMYLKSEKKKNSNKKRDAGLQAYTQNLKGLKNLFHTFRQNNNLLHKLCFLSWTFLDFYTTQCSTYNLAQITEETKWEESFTAH